MKYLIMFCMMIFMRSAVAQIEIFNGTVSNKAGLSLEDVTIRNHRTKIVVKTDRLGFFQIKAQPGDSIVAYRIGYDSLYIRLGLKKDVLNLVMIEKTYQIAEVLVSTGYQNIQKDKMTGSHFFVDKEILDRTVGSNVLDRLTDVVPGLNFNSTTPKISIRGINTIHGDMSPLIIVDNFPYEGDISNINPEDVENITVLKDAAAAAIWGTKAGNGVIVINTKKGAFNKPTTVTFNTNFTIGKRENLFYKPVMGMVDYIDTERRLFTEGAYAAAEKDVNRSVISEFVELLIARREEFISEEELLKQTHMMQQRDVRHDINKYLRRNSFDTRSLLDIKGGGHNYAYIFSTGYDKHLSNQKGFSDDRITLRNSNTFNFIDNRLSLSTDINVVSKNEILDGQAISVGISPYETFVDENNSPRAIYANYRKSWVDNAEEMGFMNWQYNPIQELENSDKIRKTNVFKVNVASKYRILEKLNLNILYQNIISNATYRVHNDVNSYFTRDMVNRFTQFSNNSTLAYPIPKQGILDINQNNRRSYSIRGFLQYSNRWKKHELDGIAGWEKSENRTLTANNRLYGYDDEYASNSVVDFLTRFPMSYNERQNEGIPYQQGMTDLINRNISYYTNIGYSYDQRFSFSASLRKDQSNVFGVSANQKGVPLYSFGAVWNLNKESFFKTLNIGTLRIKGSFGYNGNMDNTLSSQITAKYSGATATYLPKAEIINPPNSNLRWERIKIINGALQWTSPNRIFDGSIEYYTKRGLDLIGDSPFATSSGVSRFRGNTAETKGKGLEIMLSSLNINRIVKWNTTFLFSFATDKIVRYFLPPNNMSTVIEYGTLSSPIEGVPRFALFSYQWGGLNPENGNPLGYIANDTSENYNSIINNATRDDVVYHGSTIPPYFGSIRNTISWRNWSFSANISYRLGYYVRFKSIVYAFNYGLGGHADIYNRWQTSGDEEFTQIPSMPLSGGNSYRDRFYTYSSQLVERGDHIRLNDIKLSYSFKQTNKKMLGISNLQCFVYMNNLGLIWTRNSRHIEPNNNNQPLPLQISGGLKFEL